MRKIIVLASLICGTATVWAAGDGNEGVVSASASQTIQLELTDQIEIGFVNTGAIVDLSFSNTNNFASGVESTDQQIRVRSNRKFEVKAQANADYFTYIGSSPATPSMKVKDVLSLMVSSNNTGGHINNSYTHFSSVNGSVNNAILQDCSNGSGQVFSIRYRANTGFQYPAGNYTVTMVYTATQS